MRNIEGVRISKKLYDKKKKEERKAAVGGIDINFILNTSPEQLRAIIEEHKNKRC